MTQQPERGNEDASNMEDLPQAQLEALHTTVERLTIREGTIFAINEASILGIHTRDGHTAFVQNEQPLYPLAEFSGQEVRDRDRKTAEQLMLADGDALTLGYVDNCYHPSMDKGDDGYKYAPSQAALLIHRVDDSVEMLSVDYNRRTDRYASSWSMITDPAPLEENLHDGGEAKPFPFVAIQDEELLLAAIANVIAERIIVETELMRSLEEHELQGFLSIATLVDTPPQKGA